jgi:hypothetical protein
MELSETIRKATEWWKKERRDARPDHVVCYNCFSFVNMTPPFLDMSAEC